MESTPMIDGLLRSLSDLHDACRDLDIDQIIISPGGRWTIRKLGHVHRHPSPLNHSDVQSLQQLMSSKGQGLAVKLGWLFRLHPSLDGWAIWGERLPSVHDTLVDEESAQVLLRHVEQGSNGVIIGPPGSRKNHVLAWLTKQYVQEQIVFVSELPPRETFGPRVLHLFPPRDRADARVFSRFLSQCDVVLWDRIAHPYDLQDCMGFVGASHRWMTFDAQSQQIGITAFAKMWRQQDWGDLSTVVLTEIRRHNMSAVSGVIHRNEGQWTSLDPDHHAISQHVAASFGELAHEVPPRTREEEHTITVDLPSHSESNNSSDLRITMEAQEHVFLDARDELDIPRVKTTFPGIPKSEEIPADLMPDVSASYHDIFEDSEGSSVVEIEDSSAFDDDVPIPEQTTPSVVLSRPAEEPHTEELELDLIDDVLSTDVAVPSVHQEIDLFEPEPTPTEQRASLEDIWETTQEYDPEETDAPEDDHSPLPETTQQDVEPMLFGSPKRDTLKTPIAQAAIMQPTLAGRSEPISADLSDVFTTTDKVKTAKHEHSIQYMNTLDQVSSVDITNNVSGAQLDALLPQLSEFDDDDEELEDVDASAFEEDMVKDMLGINTSAPLLMDMPSEPEQALQALDSLYDLDVPSQHSILDDEDDEITSSRPLPQPPTEAPVDPIKHPQIKKLAWGDDEETISRSMPQYPPLGQSRSGAPDDLDPTSTSSSIRLNNLSRRLKTLRKQRLENDDSNIPPTPPEEVTPPTVEDEPTQITTLPDPEPRDDQSPNRYVIRNKEELLKRLKQHSKE